MDKRSKRVVKSKRYLYIKKFDKLEVWTINHCLGLGHETMVCAVCLSVLF